MQLEISSKHGGEMREHGQVGPVTKLRSPDFDAPPIELAHDDLELIAADRTEDQTLPSALAVGAGGAITGDGILVLVEDDCELIDGAPPYPSHQRLLA